MNKNKKNILGKEHFEILLENIDTKFELVMEGYQKLNKKVDTIDAKFEALSNELHATREELIFLIKSSIDHSEARLTKKIEDGDYAVIAQLTRKIEDGDNVIIAQLTKKIEDGDNAVKESVMSHVDLKIDEVKDILRVHSDRLDAHDERLSKLERRG